MKERKSYVYRHRRLDTNEIFYVGKGTKKDRKYFLKYETEYERAFSHKNRNHWWTNIINKTNFQVEILLDNLFNNEAEELEILLISEYKRKDCCGGTLVNMTDGGEGVKNINDNARKIKSEKMLGEKNPMWGGNFSSEHIKKLSISHKGIIPWNKGKIDVFSEESNKKRSDSLKGRLPWNTGMELSQSHKDKIKSNTPRRFSGEAPASKKVLQISTGLVWNSIRDCARDLNISYTNLSICLSGKAYYPKYRDFIYY